MKETFQQVGDAFCAAFDTAPAALAAALAAQRSLHAEAWDQTGELRSATTYPSSSPASSPGW